MQVFVIIVTYGNRFYLLRQTIDAALAEGVAQVIVIDNNSHEESKTQLKAYENKLNGKIRVLYLDENFGSAGGFKRGLQEAYNDSKCEFLWLLDDDNLPLRGALQSLYSCWENIKLYDKEKKIALLSWRKNKEFYQIKSIIKKDPYLVLGKKNSFIGFHIFQFPTKLFRFMKRLFFKRDIKLSKYLNNLEKNNINYGEISVAPYGGLFIHKNLIENIGYPDEEFFTYADDHEWTYRITRSGGKIYLCWKSQIEDLEMSWHIKDNRLSAFTTLLKSGDDFRTYYSIRNRVYFENKDLVSNRFIYNINRSIFLFFLTILSLTIYKIKELKVIKRAVKDGLERNIGKVFLEKLK
ncbi:MAG: glycosyltransferase [Bacteroidales bacterium]|nr:glycosyltransferase [Bacteroidales bacterium]